KKRLAANAETGSRIVQWKKTLRENWHKIKFGDLFIEKGEDYNAFNATIYLGTVSPEQVNVELYANGVNGSKPTMVMMDCSSANNLEGQEYNYYGKVDFSRDQGDFTVRITPKYEGLSVPLEENLIHWHH